MSNMASATYRDPTPVVKALHSSGVLNKHLQAMLKSEHLSTSGVKADMQARVEQQLKHHAATDPAAFDRLKRMIEHPRQIETNEGAYSARQSGSYSSPSAQYPVAGGPPPRAAGGLQYGQPQAFRGVPSIEFHTSPFYKIQKQLGETRVCDMMVNHRNGVHVMVKTNEYPELQNLDPDTRVYVFCAAGSGLGRQHVLFPDKCEIKVNGTENRRSLRGIGKRPGTSRPLDITDMLRLKLPKYENDVELVYALTKEAGAIPVPPKFYLLVNLVKTTSLEELVKGIASGKKITKASVVNELSIKARDPDIVVGSSVLSLKCPLSTLRIGLPCRATTCKHMQCFDAMSYIQLQQQAPSWQCPVCNMPATIENLAVDEYVKEILTNTPKSVDQVTIEPDGTWSQFTKKAAPSPHFSSASGDDDDDDDIVEIKDSRVTALKTGSNGSGTPTSVQSMNTPPGSSREPSSSVGPPKQSNGKRPASAVIDLTLSDDDDEPIARPAKRAQYGTPNGGVSNGSTLNGIPHRGGYLA